MLGPQLDFIGDTGVLFEGKEYTFFGGNDYHRFSRRPELLAAMAAAAERYGINTAGSRLTTANHPLYLELEARLAEFLGAEAAILCSAGYLSSSILVQGIAELYDVLFVDETAHGSLVDAAQQTGKSVERYSHADPDALGLLMRTTLSANQVPLILTDGIFASMGDIPPLAELTKLASRFGGKVVCDDAHAAGVIGELGQGSWEEAGISRDHIYQTGTLSKGLGGFGGFVAGSNADIARIRFHSRAFTGSTPPPLPIAAASIKALELLTSERYRITLLRERTRVVKQRLKAAGFAVAVGDAPICSVTYLNPHKNQLLCEKLRANGIFAAVIDYPGSPPGGHYRFTLSSAHSDNEINHFCSVLEAGV